MCKCLERSINLVKADNAGKEELEVAWQNGFFLFNNKPFIPVCLKILVSYRRRKTNGNLYSNKTKEEISVQMKYCPMCGIKVLED